MQTAPLTVMLSFWTWLILAGLAAIGMVTSFLTGLAQESERLGLFVLAGVLLVLGASSAIYAFQLRRGRNAARKTVTTTGLMIAAILFIRGLPVMVIAGVIILAGVALLWLPASNRYFKPARPKARR
jgi:hypothetical protein